MDPARPFENTTSDGSVLDPIIRLVVSSSSGPSASSVQFELLAKATQYAI